MSSRRLEGPGLDARAGGAVDAHDIAGAGRTTIHRRRLSVAGKPGTQASEADGADEAALLAFASSGAEAGKSLDEILDEFVMPSIADPAILKRSVSLLQTFVDDLVPHLEGGDQLKELARNLMGEEIERRRELMTRIQEGLT
jgi:hypothetical protein